ncbi:hypothetical protein KIS4809_2125 [Bacillus sp. ZZV12-4809]|nr:hypothetical protein KIS4809_2125 [Bacillus sp. ZZV12-4809]
MRSFFHWLAFFVLIVVFNKDAVYFRIFCMSKLYENNPI